MIPILVFTKRLLSYGLTVGGKSIQFSSRWRTLLSDEGLLAELEAIMLEISFSLPVSLNNFFHKFSPISSNS
jgi:hypothetical protein